MAVYGHGYSCRVGPGSILLYCRNRFLPDSPFSNGNAVWGFPAGTFQKPQEGIYEAIGKLFKLSYQDNTSLIITTLARNAPLAIVIAIAVFPERALIPLVLAVESVIELPLLYIFAQILLIIK